MIGSSQKSEAVEHLLVISLETAYLMASAAPPTSFQVWGWTFASGDLFGHSLRHGPWVDFVLCAGR